ncbi:MAG: MFS transporter, partial [bacterium]|nr:MFS transporter [bacterium]
MAEAKRREQRAWYVYDWANSAFYTTVVTLFFGPYLTSLASEAAGPDGQVRVFGSQVQYQAAGPYLVSLSVMTQVLVLPILGSLADYGRRKREMLGGVAYLGAAARRAMYVLEGN